MRIIGVTGSIASGKTTVAHLMAGEKYPLFSADMIVSRLYKKSHFIEIILWENINDKSEDVDVIINATTLGMKGGSDFKQVFKKFKANLVYYDVIYNPAETMMIKNFKKQEVKTFNGLEMFIYQGQKSFFLWNKINPKLDEELKKRIISELK